MVVITGFQGVSDDGHITTLGRGGSDTQAWRSRPAMKADECLIYTDVDVVPPPTRALSRTPVR